MFVTTVIRSLISYICVGVVGMVVSIPCLIIASLPVRWRRDNRVYFFFVNILYQVATWATFLPITIKGRENIPQEPVIFAPNHLSALDIPFVGSLIGQRSHVWLFIKKYAHVPFFGFVARRMNIVVDTATPRTMMRALKQAVDVGKDKKRDIVIFPEGGRSLNGEMQNFFSGFAVIAEQTKLPVIPIRIYNLEKAFPIGAFFIRNYPITLSIGKPMHMLEGESREAFVVRVKSWMENPV